MSKMKLLDFCIDPSTRMKRTRKWRYELKRIDRRASRVIGPFDYPIVEFSNISFGFG